MSIKPGYPINKIFMIYFIIVYYYEMLNGGTYC